MEKGFIRKNMNVGIELLEADPTVVKDATLRNGTTMETATATNLMTKQANVLQNTVKMIWKLFLRKYKFNFYELNNEKKTI